MGIPLRQMLYDLGCQEDSLILPNIYLKVGQEIRVFAAPLIPKVLLSLDELDKVLESRPSSGYELVIKRVR